MTRGSIGGRSGMTPALRREPTIVYERGPSLVYRSRGFVVDEVDEPDDQASSRHATALMKVKGLVEWKTSGPVEPDVR
jgi:hypothetical protein